MVDSGYKVYMKLRIRNVGPKDFMDYKCLAKNSLGGTDGKITLYQVNPPTTPTTTTSTTEKSTTTTPPATIKKPGRRRKFRKCQRGREKIITEDRITFTIQEEKDIIDQVINRGVIPDLRTELVAIISCLLIIYKKSCE